MSVDIIAAIIQLVLSVSFVGYVFYVVHKWSKVADEIQKIIDENLLAGGAENGQA